MTKEKKGITLIALVITIIILLILAGITIATLFGENGIIKIAQKAKEETEKVQEETSKQLEELENQMKDTLGNIEHEETTPKEPTDWQQDENGKITNGVVTLKLGDYVNYNCTTSNATYTSLKEKTGHENDQVFKANEYTYGWRVLGVNDNKQLLLISEEFIPLIGGGDLGSRIGRTYYLAGKTGYSNGTEELNQICSIFGTGEGAVGARCVNAYDVNKITGYNPNNTGVKSFNSKDVGKKYEQGGIEYGDFVKYTLTANGVKYELVKNNEISGIKKEFTKFAYYDGINKTWKDLMLNESVSIDSSIYYYYPTTLNTKNDLTASIGIGTNTPEYKMLFTNSSTGADIENSGKTTNFAYWLNTKSISTLHSAAMFGFNIVNSGMVGMGTVYDTIEQSVFMSLSLGIRPVVLLESKIELKDSGTQKDGCKLYNLVIK